jgi:hypothetical protein
MRFIRIRGLRSRDLGPGSQAVPGARISTYAPACLTASATWAGEVCEGAP